MARGLRDSAKNFNRGRRFHSPLVEPDMQNCRIRLSDPIRHDYAHSERRSIAILRFTKP